jgi:hypothetical protein
MVFALFDFKKECYDVSRFYWYNLAMLQRHFQIGDLTGFLFATRICFF